VGALDYGTSMKAIPGAAVLLAAAIAAGQPSPDPLPAQGAPSSDPLDLFRTTGPVYQHARCLNCHGGVRRLADSILKKVEGYGPGPEDNWNLINRPR